MVSKKTLVVLISILFFALGWATRAFYYNHIRQIPEPLTTAVREDSPEYEFTKPLLFTDNSKVVYRELDPLKKEMSSYIEKATVNNSVQNVSVYYRDLTSGKWTGVNEDEKYIPSSMLKVAVLLVYLDLAETNPDIISEKFHYDTSYNVGQHYPPAQTFKDGDYKVDTLLGQMIVESDNAAALALSVSKEKKLTDLYTDLKLPIPPDKLHDFMSAESFSVLFRTLYNSTYLIPSLSEQALRLLSRTTFNKGLVAGVPEGTHVAHKFGEHTILYPDPTKGADYELHDCGIIYASEKPYLLCVMTKGKDFGNLEKIIADLSKQAYEYTISKK